MLLRLAELNDEEGQGESAEDWRRQATTAAREARWPDQPGGLGWCAAAYRAAGNPERARELFEEALENARGNPNPFNHVLAATRICQAHHHFGLDLSPDEAEGWRSLVLAVEGESGEE